MKTTLHTLLTAGLIAGSASAADVLVTSDIATSTTWTADNVYNLQDQIYVLPGATLTIEAGTLVASTANLGGSLAVCRGAQINVLGTASAPVIMTSDADDLVTWRESCNEWGNLTIMGNAYISENATVGNTPFPSATNVAAMEGLVAAFPGDPNVLYGGGDDDDDSGSISYLSLRYGGRVIGLGNELNGLSLGGIGRGTDIHHVEIMNNVDDGIEIWGGTFNLKNFSIWNIGDDSLDIDQGFRGRAQYGLIVQGFSTDASQGSGVGDNACEIDGAEDSDWQPVTTTSLYNLTVIGQPIDGDGLTAWRDNANVQYRKCVFMDCGEKVVRFDGDDGDGANGYGFNGTLDWPTRWTTAYNTYSTINAPGNAQSFYRAQFNGNLIEMTDSVFFNNTNGSAYTEANARNVFDAANNNVLEPATSPVTDIQRAAPVVRGGKVMQQVTFLDPAAAGDATTAAGSIPAGTPFFEDVAYRGAFAPGENWLAGWSAASAYGFVPGVQTLGTEYCSANANSTGVAGTITATGSDIVADNTLTLTANNLPQLQFGLFVTSPNQASIPVSSGILCVGGPIGRFTGPGQIKNSGAAGAFEITVPLQSQWPVAGVTSVVPGDTYNFTAWFRDIGAVSNFTNAVSITFQ
ncbi:MAG: hypothetical protein ISQ08_12175 [Planctomycetes bacterium]|nr:hypothetical protein [Planctomycetota bacterium]